MKLNGVDMKIICVAASLLKALCVPFMTRIIFTMPIKNVKNEKNVENKERGSYEPRKKGDPYYPADELLETAFRECLSIRIKIKKPLATKQALTRMMNKIQTLSGGDNDLAVKILNQSTDHCWTDVYDLKNDYNGRQKKTDYNKPIDWSGV